MLKIIAFFAAIMFLAAAPLTAHAQSDTLEVSFPAIVVFTCSQAERDSLARDPNSGVEEVLDDFLFYFSQARPWLDSNSVTMYETTTERFVVVHEGKTLFTYDRKARNEIVGCVLLTKGKAPKVLPNVNTDEKYRQEFETYYGDRKRGKAR